MTTLIADIEADGLLDTVTSIWQLSIADADSDQTWSFNASLASDGDIWAGIRMLEKADAFVFHNGLGFDLPAIKNVLGAELDWRKCIDTLVLSKLGKPEREGFRPHSLETWGERLGIAKIEHTDWTQWSPEMERRCNTDVQITKLLYERLKPMLVNQPVAVELEHACAHEVTKMVARGFGIDVDYTRALANELRTKQEETLRELHQIFTPVLISAGEPKTLRSVNRRHALYGMLEPGVPFSPVEVQEFNPASRQQVAGRLIRKYGWKPHTFTPGGQPEVSEDTLASLPYPEARVFAEYLRVEKLLSFIEGQPKRDGGGGGWLHHEKGGRVYASLNPLKAVTGRPSCSSPNLQQVPTDARMRRAFIPTPGRVLVGVDAEGLELRCLGHYLAAFDGGAYSREVVNGDIHTLVMDLIGFRLSADAEIVKKVNRQNTKRIEYALIYGAGDAKLGLIARQNAQQTGCDIDYATIGVVPGKRQPANSTVGAAIRAALIRGIPGLGKLTDAVKAKARATKQLRGLDGRTLWVRSPHSALNLLLQSAGIIIVKKAMAMAPEIMAQAGLTEDQHYWPVLWVHDEWQVEAVPARADQVGQVLASTFAQAGAALGFRCELSGSYNVGSSWAETH